MTRRAIMGSLSRRNATTKNLQKALDNPFFNLHREVDRAIHGFYELFEPKQFLQEQFERINLLPSMDLIEDDKCFKLELEMPGMDEKDIKVAVHDNILTITGEKQSSKKDEDKNYIAREISYGCYERSIALPQTANGNKIEATFKKGMLWVTIPKKTESLSRTQEIKVNKA